MTLKVGINGFGRIGRNFLRAAKKHGADIDIVGVNDLTSTETLGHLLKYDSVHGVFPGTVEVDGENLIIDGDTLRVLSVRDPAALPWRELAAQVVIESTGLFTSGDKAAAHLKAGAAKVIISAPAKGEDVTLVMGVNHDRYDPESHDIISNASCTTNSVVPMAKVLDEEFGIDRGFMTTIHAYTNDQGTQDAPHKDLRRARAAAINIVPTTTGAAKAASLALPQLDGKLDGMAMRVPVPDGSVTDLVCNLGEEVTVDQVNEAFTKAAAGDLRGVLEVSMEPIVSSDIVGNPNSCIIDGLATMAMGNTVKVLGWYDNEWGYSNRLIDLAEYVGSSL